MIFYVSYPEEAISQKHRQMWPYKVLYSPLINIIVLGIVVSLLYSPLQNLYDIYFNVKTGDSGKYSVDWNAAILPIAAAFGLIVGGLAIFWLSVRSAMKSWKLAKYPTAESLRITPDLHFGDGTIELLSEGLLFKRKLYQGMISWGAIDDMTIDDDGLTHANLKSGTLYTVGYVENSETAKQLSACIDKYLGKNHGN